GQTQPLEVLQQTWTLHYPDDVVLLSSYGLLTPTQELARDSWLTRIREAITLPTLTEAGWRVGIAAAVAVVIAGFALLIRRLGRWTLALMIALPIVLLMLALLLPTVQQSREAARRAATDDMAATQAPPAAAAFEAEMSPAAGTEAAPPESPPVPHSQAPPAAGDQPVRPQTPVSPFGQAEQAQAEGRVSPLQPARGAQMS